MATVFALVRNTTRIFMVCKIQVFSRTLLGGAVHLGRRNGVLAAAAAGSVWAARAPAERIATMLT